MNRESARTAGYRLSRFVHVKRAIAPFECARDERMHGGDFLSGAPARLGFLRDLAGE